jgi:Tfp pilus assembly protein PilP
MQVVKDYFDGLEDFKNIYESWNDEMETLKNYIQQCKEEGKPTTHFEIRKNNNYNRMQAVLHQFQKATDAIIMLQNVNALQKNKNADVEPTPVQRKTLQELPAYSNEIMLNKILNILQNQYGE